MLLVLVVWGCARAPGPVPEREAARPGNIVVSGVPALPAGAAHELMRYRNVRSAYLMGWAEDGVVIGTRFGETTQLHRLKSPLGAREQITFFAEPVRAAFLPTGAGAVGAPGFVLSRDAGGSEFYQLFVFDWSTGQSRMVSNGRARYTNVLWSNRGDRFAYTTTERDGRRWDIHLQDLAGRIEVALETTDGGWRAVDFSPADDRLLLIKYVSATEAYLYELELATGALRPLLDEGLAVAIGGARYAGDGEGVYFTADLGAEFMRLHLLELETGHIDVLTAEVPWDVTEIAVTSNGAHLAMVTNEGGISRLGVLRLPDHAPLALPEVPVGTIYGLRPSPDGRQLGFTVNAPTAPGDVYSLDLVGRTLTRWTRSEVGGLDASAFAAPRLVHYPTFDDEGGAPREIPAFVYMPDGPGPHPVVVHLHGGPHSQYRPKFSASAQYYVKELGLAVVAPNFRGSSGYGKNYLKLDDGYLREDAVRDVGALLDWIAAQPRLDAGRVAVSGGSYGGYMAMASLIRYGDRLVAGVSRVGISNFVTFLENTRAYRRDLRREEYGDERDPRMRTFLEGISPLGRADEIERPLLLIHGFNDPRVPASESEQIADALSAVGAPVWYVLAMDEGHGFRKKANSDYAAAVTALFLQRYLIDG
ncbi:MAG: prolyl oligopeptidase family serine peptidase [Pseudomonadales bacterium]|nr:prolyl oligopeptidase family serine peptidase [Pseudomonadales bacterium]NIX07060.1 prolyl oligopeptidase family serine peptidase [Pseudomonadales bacterium]